MTPPSVYQIDPLADPRWRSLAEEHRHSSIFHQPAWLKALSETYGFRPLALTTAAPETPLSDGLVLCRIESRLTGRRIVSLPFSDHCRVLDGGADSRQALLTELKQLTADEWKSCEVRDPRLVDAPRQTPVFCLHTLKLDSADKMFANLHASSIRRKVRRARREGVEALTGRTDSLLEDFYSMLLMTRRRHGLPPQPAKWFNALRDHMGNAFSVSVAYRDRRPAAAIVTLRSRETVYYKYGGSDASLNPLGSMPLLLWNAMESAADEGFKTFDLGRSAIRQQGLVTFKDRFGATRDGLPYLRWPAESNRLASAGLQRVFGRVVATLPDRLLTRLGEFLYPHAA